MAFNKKATLTLSIVIGFFVYYTFPEKSPAVIINTHRIKIELANTPETRSLGLMNRQSLDINTGMLFTYNKEQFIRIWMKNTHIPLDIIWINKHKEIIHIEKETTPQSQTILSADNLAQYVLEVNAGISNIYAFEVGNKVKFKNLQFLNK
jgi:uncharacterized protein